MSEFKLTTNPRFDGVPGQLLLVILDGVGLYRGRAEGYDGNAFDIAATPNLDRLFSEAPAFLELKAHGTAVGLPTDGDMGNSEVGHNAIGAGRIFEQGAKLVSRAISSGAIFEGLPERVAAGSTFTLVNESAVELHELVAIKLPEGEERTADELVQLPPGELAQFFPMVDAVIIAPPEGEGFPVEGTGTLTEPGRYLIICAIPTGADPDEYMAAAA